MDFLTAFFQREHRFFLTGGAALVGFHLGHRETYDLDLFTLDDVVNEGFSVVQDVAQQMNRERPVFESIVRFSHDS